MRALRCVAALSVLLGSDAFSFLPATATVRPIQGGWIRPAARWTGSGSLPRTRGREARHGALCCLAREGGGVGLQPLRELLSAGLDGSDVAAGETRLAQALGGLSLEVLREPRGKALCDSMDHRSREPPWRQPMGKY